MEAMGKHNYFTPEDRINEKKKSGISTGFLHVQPYYEKTKETVPVAVTIVFARRKARSNWEFEFSLLLQRPYYCECGFYGSSSWHPISLKPLATTKFCPFLWTTRNSYLVPHFPETTRNHQISPIPVDNEEFLPGTYIRADHTPIPSLVRHLQVNEVNVHTLAGGI